MRAAKRWNDFHRSGCSHIFVFPVFMYIFCIVNYVIHSQLGRISHFADTSRKIYFCTVAERGSCTTDVRAFFFPLLFTFYLFLSLKSFNSLILLSLVPFDCNFAGAVLPRLGSSIKMEKSKTNFAHTDRWGREWIECMCKGEICGEHFWTHWQKKCVRACVRCDFSISAATTDSAIQIIRTGEFWK